MCTVKWLVLIHFLFPHDLLFQLSFLSISVYLHTHLYFINALCKTKTLREYRLCERTVFIVSRSIRLKRIRTLHTVPISYYYAVWVEGIHDCNIPLFQQGNTMLGITKTSKSLPKGNTQTTAIYYNTFLITTPLPQLSKSTKMITSSSHFFTPDM